jgi:8-oxo-dGTP pyrophosphatase MutT (NUDIX family)
MRKIIKNLTTAIPPFDNLEKDNIDDAIRWIDSGQELFRIQKPDVPPKHLVSFFVLFDQKERKLLLVDHIKAGLWLPAGGHVEKDENPKTTVEREILEELFIHANFIQEAPFFITQTKTVNIDAGHTDVSLWYLLKGSSSKKLKFDSKEFNSYKWLTLEEILNMDIKMFNPNMHRFVKKLQARYPKKA